MSALSSLIAKLYAVEKRHKDSDITTRERARDVESIKILVDLKQWLDKAQREVSPTRALGKRPSATL